MHLFSLLSWISRLLFSFFCQYWGYIFYCYSLDGHPYILVRTRIFLTRSRSVPTSILFSSLARICVSFCLTCLSSDMLFCYWLLLFFLFLFLVLNILVTVIFYYFFFILFLFYYIFYLQCLFASNCSLLCSNFSFWKKQKPEDLWVVVSKLSIERYGYCFPFSIPSFRILNNDYNSGFNEFISLLCTYCAKIWIQMLSEKSTAWK